MIDVGTMHRGMTATRPAAAQRQSGGMVDVANQERRAGLDLGVTLQAKIRIARGEQFAIHGTVWLMTGSAAFTQGFVLEYKAPRLIAMTFGAGLVDATVCQSTLGIECIPTVGIVTVHAVQFSFDDEVMIGQAKLRMRLQVTVEAGVRFLSRIHDELVGSLPTARNMPAAGPVTRFATGLAEACFAGFVEQSVRAGREQSGVVGVTVCAGGVPDEVGVGDLRRVDRNRRHGGTGYQGQHYQPEGESESARNSQLTFLPIHPYGVSLREEQSRDKPVGRGAIWRGELASPKACVCADDWGNRSLCAGLEVAPTSDPVGTMACTMPRTRKLAPPNDRPTTRNHAQSGRECQLAVDFTGSKMTRFPPSEILMGNTNQSEETDAAASSVEDTAEAFKTRRQGEPGTSIEVAEPTEQLSFRYSEIEGRGAFARKAIPSGARVIEYVGRHITKEESAKLCEDYNEYIFDLNDDFDLDGNVEWNPSRLLNHSCDPNCSAEQDEDHIYIVADRDIRPGDEVTFNYGYSLESYRDYPCKCGTKKCVGYIVAEEYHELVRRENGLPAKG
jgi:hypothetical protein